MTVAERTVLAAKGLTGVRLSCQILVRPRHERAGHQPARRQRPARPRADTAAVHRTAAGVLRPRAVEPCPVSAPCWIPLWSFARTGKASSRWPWRTARSAGSRPIRAASCRSKRFTSRRGSRALIRSGRFEVTVDRAFEGVMRACAERPSDGTWISEEILECYVAHPSARARALGRSWQGGELVGGLYGVHLGGAFFGESMFHRVRDASKVALAALVDRLTRRGFRAARHAVGDAAPRAVRRDRDSRRDTGALKRALAKECAFD